MTLNAPTLLGEGSSTNDLNDYPTSSMTGTSGAKILALVASGKTTASGPAEPPISIEKSGIAFVKLAEIVTNNGINYLSLWEGVNNGVAGVFTIKHASVMENCIWKFIQHTSTTAFRPRVRQVAVKPSFVGTGSQAIPLSSAPAGSNSTVVSGFSCNSTSESGTVGTGFTIMGTKITATSPSNLLQAEYDNTSPSQSPAFTMSGSAQKVGISYEVVDGTSTDPVLLSLWDGVKEVRVTASIWDGAAEIPVTPSLAP